MLRLVIVAAFAVVAPNVAWAVKGAGEEQATQKGFSGAVKSSLVKKSETESLDAATKICDAQATSDAAPRTCDTLAIEENPLGASRTKVVRKCVADCWTVVTIDELMKK